MHFLIVGAGGIGAYYGARLQAAGHRVTLIARGEHLQALRTHGLQVEHEEFRFHREVNALDDHALRERHTIADFDLVILTFKAGATAGWINQAADWLTPGNTPVLSLQNGVDNEPAIARVAGRARTLGGLAVRIGGHILRPGMIEASGPAQVIFGAWPNARDNTTATDRLEEFARAFNEAGIPSTLTDTIGRELWRKLLINNGVNPLSALTGLDTRTLTRHPDYRPAIRAIMEETARAASADGILLDTSDVDEMLALITGFNAIKTSMLVDREKGRPLELDGISGAVLRRCETLGLPAPVTGLVTGLLRQQLDEAPG